MKRDCRVVLVLVRAAVVLVMAPASESATAPKKSKSELAYYQDNPYQYLYGNVVNARLFRHGDQQFTNVEVKPVETSPMFTQFVTFCGNQGDKLDLTTSEPVVLVYSRIMHRRDCFDLLRVDVVQKARQAGFGGYYTTNKKNFQYWSATERPPAGCLPADLDRGSVGHQLPDLLDFRVGHGDAAFGPVGKQMLPPYPGIFRGQSMDHDVAAGVDSETLSALFVGRLRIRDVQS